MAADDAATLLSALSIADLKRELMDLNDSSFVFDDRDELECALLAARTVRASKRRAGLDDASLASSAASTATEDCSRAASAALSSASSSARPVVGIEAAGDAPPAPPPPPPAADALPDDDDDDDATRASDTSRRLVEYFVLVSCVPVPDADRPRGRRKKRPRPPDPARDRLNSRTAGRFEVRAVHLSRATARRGNSLGSIDGDDVQLGAGDAGSDGEEDAAGGPEDALLEPRITARYPTTDHPDQPLNLRLPQFCHPEGTDLLHPTAEYRMPRVHHFVLTDASGGKQYGTALTVLEEFKGADGDGPAGEEEAQDGITYYAPRVLVLLSTWPYLTAFRTYLTQLYRLATTTNVMTCPIERYVQNICEEVPAPPPGAFEVRLDILGSAIRFWAPPADQPIPYVSLPFQVLFECLDIGNVLFAWYTLACEQKVLLVSSQLSLLTVCAEILNSLLFPMRWSHLYIPVLPRSLCPMLDAPMPYLCGISRENFPYAVEDISDETVVVDLDRNVISLGPASPDLPPLPHARRKKLEAALKAHAGEVFWEARGLTKTEVLRARAAGDEGRLTGLLDQAGAVWEERVRTRDDAFNLAHAPGSVSLQSDEDANNGGGRGPSRWDAVQEGFLRFYASLLQDYRAFLPAGADLGGRSTWRGSKGGGPAGMSNLRFDAEGFVAAAPAEFRPFLEELTITQQFDDFVSRKMHNKADAPDIKFFDQSIDAKRNRSRLLLKKKETPFLHSASAHRALKRVRAVEPNGEGLPPRQDGDAGSGVYMYKVWPVGFDERLFGAARPIPDIISAEFDRRKALRSLLRSRHGSGHDPRGGGGRNRSPEVTAFVLFFVTFTSVIGKELLFVERRASGGGVGGFPDKKVGGATLHDDTEVARTIAKAQIDLGYNTLLLMRARKLPPEAATYMLLIQACGRCRVTHRAAGLMDLLARDGLATNPEIYTSLIAAFSNDQEHQPSSLALYQMYAEDDSVSNLSSSLISGSMGGFVTKQLLLETQASSTGTPSEYSLDHISESTPSEMSGLVTSRKARVKHAMASKLSANKQALKNAKAKSKRKMTPPGKPEKRKHSSLKMTPAIAKQIELGDRLLESLYPSISIDNDNACPKCAAVLDENAVAAGWTPCASNDYQTTCPSCQHKFVPKFSVACGSPAFEGSQGKGTPLYCDRLSPWVLLREIRGVVVGAGGVESMLDESFRMGSDISATLWWNVVVTFRRYKIPCIFLLQGSFQNQLILPSPTLGESMTDIAS